MRFLWNSLEVFEFLDEEGFLLDPCDFNTLLLPIISFRISSLRNSVDVEVFDMLKVSDETKVIGRSMIETATFALGCFWDPDARFGALEGVLVTRVGFSGGTDPPHPTYRKIGDFTETVQIDFDPQRLSYSQLLSIFNQIYIPNNCRTRTQYAAAIFYHNDDQWNRIKEMKFENVRIDRFREFFLAEESHQKYNFKRTFFLTDVLGKKDDWTDCDPEMLTKLNGFLAGYGTREEFHRWSFRQRLTREQQTFIQNRFSN